MVSNPLAPAARTRPPAGDLPPYPAPARGAAGPALALALALTACATPKQAWRPPTPEVLVELLPSDATLSVDGVAQRRGGVAVKLPDPGHVYQLRAEAPGFLAATAAGDAKTLAGTRVGLVLRPQGYGLARPLGFDDGPGLASAAVLLGRRGQHRVAREYAARAVEAAPEVALGHRALADAAYALGDRKLAAREYSEYLGRAPDAGDRAMVVARVAELRGDLTIPGAEP